MSDSDSETNSSQYSDSDSNSSEDYADDIESDASSDSDESEAEDKGSSKGDSAADDTDGEQSDTEQSDTEQSDSDAEQSDAEQSDAEQSDTESDLSAKSRRSSTSSVQAGSQASSVVIVSRRGSKVSTQPRPDSQSTHLTQDAEAGAASDRDPVERYRQTKEFQELKELMRKKERGWISDAEYEKRKAELLPQPRNTARDPDRVTKVVKYQTKVRKNVLSTSASVDGAEVAPHSVIAKDFSLFSILPNLAVSTATIGSSGMDPRSLLLKPLPRRSLQLKKGGRPIQAVVTPAAAMRHMTQSGPIPQPPSTQPPSTQPPSTRKRGTQPPKTAPKAPYPRADSIEDWFPEPVHASAAGISDYMASTWNFRNGPNGTGMKKRNAATAQSSTKQRNAATYVPWPPHQIATAPSTMPIPDTHGKRKISIALSLPGTGYEDAVPLGLD